MPESNDNEQTADNSARLLATKAQRSASAAELEPLAQAAKETTKEANGALTSQAEEHARSAMLTGIFVLLLLIVLTYAKTLFIPIVFAAVLNLLFSPLVRRLKRYRVPTTVASLLIVLGLFFGFGSLLKTSIDPAMQWVAKFPDSVEKIQRHIGGVASPMRDVTLAAEAVEKISAGAETSGKPKAEKVVVATQTPQEKLAVYFQSFFGMTMATLVLLFFMLANGDSFIPKLMELADGGKERRKLLTLSRRLEHDVSRYLVLVTVINSCLGVLVGLIMWGLGMPTPVLWGVMAMLLNFLPYVGPMGLGALLLAAGLISFDSFWPSILPAVCYLALTSIEGQLITPLVQGVGLKLSPVMIIIFLMAWGWMWGLPGIILAVPILAILKIFAKSIPGLRGLAAILER